LNPLDWLLFTRVGGPYGGHIVAYITWFAATALVTWKLVRLRRPSGLRVALLPLLPFAVACFLISFGGAVFEPQYIVARSLFDGSWPHFVAVWGANLASFRTDQMLFWAMSAAGLLLLRKDVAFRLRDWWPYLLVNAAWFALGFPASLPLPDGSGPFSYHSYLSNGFELLSGLMMSVAQVRMFKGSAFPAVEAPP
jgi:hypothetical protein